MDQSDARSAGIFSRRTNQTQEARVYSPRPATHVTTRLRLQRFVVIVPARSQGPKGWSHRRPNKS
eukprot:4737526-Pyramimonas_sp.AAC.1